MASTPRPWIMASLVLLTGCSVAAQPAANDAPVAAVQKLAAAPQLASNGSLPFKTLAFDDGGVGRYFAAGASETVVLRSKADLDAFVARHKPAVEPVFGPFTPGNGNSPMPVVELPPPNPDGSTPAPAPTFAPSPLPKELTGLDFGKWEAIAFFDGDVKVASLSRILAVTDQSGAWTVATKRWEPPANPDAIKDTNGRLHVIAIPRADASVSFTQPQVEVSTGANGGYSVGGNPVMDPRWPAIPNPDVTRDSIETMLRRQQTDPNVKIDLQFEAASNFLDPVRSYTPDSNIWIAHLTGGNVQGGFAGPMSGAQDVTMAISPEDGIMMSAFSKGPQAPSGPASPNLTVGRLDTSMPSGLTYVGDPLTVTLTGPDPSTPVTLTLASGSTTLLTKRMTIGDLSNFHPKLDATGLPGLPDLPAQDLDLKLDMGNSGTGSTFHLVKDRTAVDLGDLVASGGQYPGMSLDDSLEKMARTIASDTWKGTNLSLTSREATAADWTLDSTRLKPVDGVKLRLYEFKGTFPTLYLPSLASGTGQATVMKPGVVRVVLAESANMVVVSDRGYEK